MIVIFIYLAIFILLMAISIIWQLKEEAFSLYTTTNNLGLWLFWPVTIIIIFLNTVSLHPSLRKQYIKTIFTQQ